MSAPQVRLAALRHSMRSIEAAAIAGIVFSAVFTAALLLMSRLPSLGAPTVEITEFYADSSAVRSVLIGLDLVPIAVIALVWFMAVVRRRIGDREDKLFSTVFMGGGLLFAALVLVGAAAASAPALVTEVAGRAPDPETSAMVRSVGSALLAVEAPRLGSLFIFSASTLGLRTGVFPRSVSGLGYVLGVALLVPIPFVDSIRFAFPLWVGLVSIVLLARRDEIPAEVSPAHGEPFGSAGTGGSDDDT